MKVLIPSDLKTMLNKGHDNPEFQFFPEENIKRIESLFDEVIWNTTGRALTKEEMIEKVADVDAIITCWGSGLIDADIVKAAKKLKIVAHMAGTVAPIVSPELYDAGVKVIGANDHQFAESVAEGALAYMLLSLRQLKRAGKFLDEGHEEGWRAFKAKREIRGILDKTVGLVSYGAIADHLARMLQPFHCKIKVYSRTISDEKLKQYNMQRASLEEIFSTCDVISIHTALNPNTEGMINKDLLKSIKDNALLVNTARGGVIDEPAMIEELKTGRFFAVLDVLCKEPHPYEPGGLYDLENVILIPHEGGPTPDRYKYIAQNIMDEVYDYLKNGTPLKSEIPKEKAMRMTGAKNK